MKTILEYKSISVDDNSVKDIDEKKGRIVGYFSVFDNKDSDNDVITKGAYKKTLSENYRRVKHLYQHDPFKPLSGTKQGQLIVTEDNKGLHFDSTVSQTSWGRDTVRLYVDGVVDEQSVGFQTVKSVEKSGYREITEIKLWEGSTVTWAANELAQTTAVKSIEDVDVLSKKMDAVMKSIRNGKYENEDIFDSLEYYFKQLQQLFINLTSKSKEATTEPIEKVTLPDTRIKRNWANVHNILNPIKADETFIYQPAS